MTESAAHERLDRIADGIHRFDTHYTRPRHTSCMIVVDDARAAVFDTGVAKNVDALVAAIESLGVPLDAVDWVIASHAHLDHMAGIGYLMQQLPSARVAAHPSAVPHLVDPSKLEKGARAVFGDEFVEREYGAIEPVAAERIIETPDDEVVTVGARQLRVVHTPGHAWHHQSVWDEKTKTVLAGDAFGLSYPELVGEDGPLLMLPTAPPQLAPEQMHASIDRIVALGPDRVQPSHFAVIEQPGAAAERLHALMDEYLELALQAASTDELLERLAGAGVAELERRGRGDEGETMRWAYDLDLRVNVQGLWHWRRRREERAAEAKKGGGE